MLRRVHTIRTAKGEAARDVCITRLAPESRAVDARFVPAVKSTQGHVVVRVQTDGRYRIFVTDSRDENDKIMFASSVRLAKGRAPGRMAKTIAFERKKKDDGDERS